MSDWSELKRLAEAGDPVSHMDMDPDQILSLIAENESLIGPHGFMADDLIKELVDNAKSFQENSCEEGEDPFVIVLLAAASRIRRQEANISKLMAESLHINNTIATAAIDDAEILADQCRGLLAEREELKAENEALRKDRDTAIKALGISLDEWSKLAGKLDESRPNTGHGHVFPRADGVRARCGGPKMCKECSFDQAAKDNKG